MTGEGITQVASGAVEGLKKEPILLAIVVLNVVAICMAAWFMSKIIEGSQRNMQTLMTACFDGRSSPP